MMNNALQSITSIPAPFNMIVLVVFLMVAGGVFTTLVQQLRGISPVIAWSSISSEICSIAGCPRRRLNKLCEPTARPWNPQEPSKQGVPGYESDISHHWSAGPSLQSVPDPWAESFLGFGSEQQLVLVIVALGCITGVIITLACLISSAISSVHGAGWRLN